MKIYKVQAPDGTIIKLEGPEGASEQEVIQQAQLLYKKPEAQSAPEKTAGDYVKQFGQATASLADTILGAPAALGQQIGYATGRAFGLSPEEATNASLKTTEPFMNPVGNAFGVTETPGYQNEASRKIMQGVNENVVKPIASATGLPEQDVGSMVGTAGIAAGPLMGRAGGAVARGAYAAEPYIAGAAKLPVTAAKAPFQFLKGAYEGVTNPVYNEATSAMVPLREQYTPIPAAQRFMGQMPDVPPQTLEQLQTQTRPTSELITSPIDKFAKATAPVSPEGFPLVPLQGRGMEAWGERVGRGIRTNPGQALAEAAVTGLTGIPVKTISQGVSELAARRLASKTGFSPEFPQAVETARQQQAQTQAIQGRAGLQSQMPTQPLLPGPGPVAPVIPMPGPQRSVNIEGQRSTLPYQIDTSNSRTQTPKQISQQVALSKIQPVQPTEVPTMAAPTPTPQPIPKTGPVVPEGTSQLPAERWSPEEQLKVKQAIEKPPVAEPAPTEPAKPDYKAKLLEKYGSEENVNKSATEIEKAIMRHRLNGSKFAEVSVSGGHATKLKNAMSEAENSGEKVRVTVTGKNGGYEVIYNAGQFTPDPSLTIKKTIIRGKDDVTFEGVTGEGKKFTGEAKGKETIIKDEDGKIIGEYIGASKKKGPTNVSQMLTEDNTPKSYRNKEEFEKARSFSVLREEPHVGTYPEGDKIIHVQKIDYGNLPKDVTRDWDQTKVFATDKSGKRVPVGKDWTELDPEPLTSQLKRKLNRD